jgi:hypothetical protein
MSIVSWMVGTADGFLADAAESQFGAVASNTGTIILLMVTLSLVGVCINMAFQFRSMDGASFFWYRRREGPGADRCAHDRRSDWPRGGASSRHRAKRCGDGKRAGGKDGGKGEAAKDLTLQDSSKRCVLIEAKGGKLSLAVASLSPDL